VSELVKTLPSTHSQLAIEVGPAQNVLTSFFFPPLQLHAKL